MQGEEAVFFEGFYFLYGGVRDQPFGLQFFK
jgi:hypothetical protein